MRVLYLTSAFPFPLTAGHLRYYYFMRELARRNSVTLFSLTGETFAPEHEAALAAHLTRIQTFRRRDRDILLGKLLKEDIRLFFGFEPAMAELRRAVSTEVERGGCDVIVMAGKRVLPAVQSVERIPIVADVCDAESLRFRGRMRVAGPGERLRAWIGCRGLQAIERRVVRRADHLLFASPRDRDALVSPSDPRASILPNGVDTTYWSRRSPDLGRRTIVFTGAMDYRPNSDAALLLTREIFPRIRREMEDARLLIVGRDPSPALRAAGRDAGVTVTGFVDDVRPHLEQAGVFAAPLRYASGIQNKILEAMAMEIPVVSSAAAAAGLSTEDGTSPPLEVSEDPPDFAQRLLRLLRRAESGRSPDREGRRFVERHFSWQHHGERLEGILAETVSQCSRRSESA